MTDLNEKLAQEAAELINGGEWRDGKWYSDGQHDAWLRALKPAASRIEKLEAQLAQSQLKRWAARWEEQSDRIEKLEAALQEFIDPCIEHCFDTCQSECDPMKDCPCFKARKALEGKDD